MADPEVQEVVVNDGTKTIEGASGDRYTSVKILGGNEESDYVIPNVDKDGIVFNGQGE
ncbi:MAG: hypothetical protein AAB457_02860 [Patescibacteria group bacterium]